MNMRSLMVAGIAVLGGGIPVSAGAQTTELIFNAYLPPFNTTRQVAIDDFAARIEVESNGTIDVTIPDASLAPDDRQYEMLRDGIADMAIVPTHAVSQVVKLTGIADLPFSAPTAEAASVALWETYSEHFEALEEYEGVKVLSMHVLTGRQILSAGEAPIDDVSDLQGMRIWSSPGPLSAATVDLGASPVSTTFAEVAETVSRGNVDGLLMTPGSAGPMGIMPEINHMTVVDGGLGSVSFAVVIADAAWERLGAEQQDAILRAAEGLPRRTGAIIDAGELEAEPEMEHVIVTEAGDAMMTEIEGRIGWQIEDWKTQAAEAGLESPDAALEFYRNVLEREVGAPQ